MEPTFLFFFLLALFSINTLSCPPPLNDFRYADNATLLAEVVAETESSNNFNPQLGWSVGVLGASPLTVWPSNDPTGKLVHIKYCYKSPADRTKLVDMCESAIRMWYNAIGNAGPGKGHRLAGLTEFKKDGKITYCTQENGGKWNLWNPDVPFDTLFILKDDKSTSMSATLGYRPEGWDDTFSRHNMYIGVAPQRLKDQIIKIAHEIGHVFGLLHEVMSGRSPTPLRQGNQKDSIYRQPGLTGDHYIHFECKNLKGYEEIKAAIEGHPTMTIDKLCSSSVYATIDPQDKYKFDAPSYSKETTVEEGTTPDGRNRKDFPIVVTNSGTYDPQSIMHYPSKANAIPRKPTLKEAPITLWRKGAKDYTPPSEINEENSRVIHDYWMQKPSEGDVEAIKRLYSWVE